MALENDRLDDGLIETDGEGLTKALELGGRKLTEGLGEVLGPAGDTDGAGDTLTGEMLAALGTEALGALELLAVWADRKN